MVLVPGSRRCQPAKYLGQGVGGAVLCSSAMLNQQAGLLGKLGVRLFWVCRLWVLSVSPFFPCVSALLEIARPAEYTLGRHRESMFPLAAEKP